MKKIIFFITLTLLLLSCSKKINEEMVMNLVNSSIPTDNSWKTFRFELTSYGIDDYYRNLIQNGFIRKKDHIASPSGLGVFTVDYGNIFELTDKSKQYVINYENNRNVIVQDFSFIKFKPPVSIYYPVEGGNEANIEIGAEFRVTPFYNSRLASYSSVTKIIKFSMKKYDDGWRIDNPSSITSQLQSCK
jgi:hypothetical protein